MSSSWTLWPGLTGSHISKAFCLQGNFVLAGLLFIAFTLTACSDHSTSLSQNTTGTTANQTASQQTLAPLLAPPGSDTKPAGPGSLGRPLGTDGLPALQPAKGVNIDTLFSEDIRDPIERSKRVETAVVELRRDLDAAMPAIKRLVAIEKDIKFLTSQLQTLLTNETPSSNVLDNSASVDVVGIPEPLMPAPAPKEADTSGPPTSDTLVTKAEASPEAPNTAIPIEPPVEADTTRVTSAATVIIPPQTAPPIAQTTPSAATTSPAPAASVAGNAVSGMRFGVDGGKTRIVFDANAALTYKKDLDNNESLLVIELPGMGWNAGASGTPPASAFVQSWSSQPLDGGGTRIVMILRKPVTVSYEATLKPEPSSPHHRLVLDLR